MPRVKEPKPSYYMGIDPGAKGGIAVLDHKGKVVCITKTPSQDKHLLEVLQEYTEPTLLKLVEQSNSPTIKALLEQVGAMPGQGVTSMFTFGVNYGKLQMALAASDIPYEKVTPQKWQAGLAIPSRDRTKVLRKGPRSKKAKYVDLESRRDYKKRLLAFARKLYPRLDVTLETADALLIATYLYRRETGCLPQQPKRRKR